MPALSDAALVAFYAPYCGGLERENDLRDALGLLAMGSLKGARVIQGRSDHAFELNWSPAKAPLEPLACQLTFPGQPERRYAFEVGTQQLVVWLMERGATGSGDLPDGFWHWLLIGPEAEADHA